MKIAIIVCDYQFNTMQALIEPLRILTKNNCEIDLFFRNVKNTSIPISDQRHIHIASNIYVRNIWHSIIYRFDKLLKYLCMPISTIYNLFFMMRFNHLNKNNVAENIFIDYKTNKYFSKHFKLNKYHAVIATSERALVIASYFAKKYKLSSILIFHSLELLHYKYFIKSNSVLWTNSILFYNYYLYYVAKKDIELCKHIIIQDDNRWRYFKEINNINKNNKYLLPVSMGPINEYYIDNTYLHKKLNIDTNKKIILSFGRIHEDNKFLEIAEMAKYLNSDYVIVLHGRIDKKDNYVQTIKKLQCERLLVSTELVPYDELFMLVRSAYIGLVFYIDDNINFKNIEYSSDKMAQFMQQNVPVITYDQLGFKELSNKYKMGVCINSIKNELLGAIKLIDTNYNYYVNGTEKCFNEIYNIQKYENGFLSLFNIESQTV